VKNPCLCAKKGRAHTDDHQAVFFREKEGEKTGNLIAVLQFPWGKKEGREESCVTDDSFLPLWKHRKKFSRKMGGTNP